MAINLSQAFNRTAPAPIDGSLVLSKAEMLAVNDNLMPSRYFTICTDDGQIYTYDKSATPNAQTGKFSPYSGGSADAGFTPVGTVIAVMGVTAPANYLACNGQVVNIADYPELANYFNQQFGSKNKFGGDGTTTFGIPDLRGEFLRGTGTNSHTNQGSGAAVGVHQDSTTFPDVFVNTPGDKIGVKSNSAKELVSSDRDFQIKSDSSGTISNTIASATKSSTGSTRDMFTSRPTNTSVLYCIATKNIYLNPSLDYSTDEKVVGTWVDGKTLYQRTFVTANSYSADSSNNFLMTVDEISIANLDSLVSCHVLLQNKLADTPPFRYVYDTSASKLKLNFGYVESASLPGGYTIAAGAYITIQYTKTTD